MPPTHRTTRRPKRKFSSPLRWCRWRRWALGNKALHWSIDCIWPAAWRNWNGHCTSWVGRRAWLSHLDRMSIRRWTSSTFPSSPKTYTNVCMPKRLSSVCKSLKCTRPNTLFILKEVRHERSHHLLRQVLQFPLPWLIKKSPFLMIPSSFTDVQKCRLMRFNALYE